MSETVSTLEAWETEPARKTRKISEILVDSADAKWFVRAKDKQGREVYLVRPTDFDAVSTMYVTTVREAVSIMKARRVGWRYNDSLDLVGAVVAKYELHGPVGKSWQLEASHTV